MYLEEEWALVLGLRAGRPEPVRQWSSLGCGDKVAQRHRLLQDVQSLLMGLHTVGTLALRDNIDEMNEQSKTCFLQHKPQGLFGVIYVPFINFRLHLQAKCDSILKLLYLCR